MPTVLAENHYVGTVLDYEKEIETPLKQGYYLESLAKIDANIDTLLDALVRQAYSKSCCQSLFNSVEYSMKENYTFVSGLVRLGILKQALRQANESNLKIKLPKNELYNNIKNFKEDRNKVLHSNRGHCALVNPLNHTTNEAFQEEAKKNILQTIANGRDCCRELEELLQDNAIILGNNM